jgi:tetratricopeptide (TPR) repeat protein
MNVSEHVRNAVSEIRATQRDDLEQLESLVDVAFDLQKKPKSPQDLLDALYLYDEALKLAGDRPLARARALAGRGAALRRLPTLGVDELEAARRCFDEALVVLREHGGPEETAEVEMSLGLVLQALATAGRAPLDHAVQAYHRALRFFSRESYPREFATLHNNLATAYLSMRLSPEKEVMREALAVQSFQEALKVVTLVEDPSEYAMLQNNLGNALQAMRSAHPFENLKRAVEAYDEALKVRTAYDTPIEYANTIANKANALMNLPDDLEHPEPGNPQNLVEAVALLTEAQQLFGRHGVSDRAQVVGELRDQLQAELTAAGGTA